MGTFACRYTLPLPLDFGFDFPPRATQVQARRSDMDFWGARDIKKSELGVQKHEKTEMEKNSLVNGYKFLILKPKPLLGCAEKMEKREADRREADGVANAT
jgi:hypothetical protein